MKHFAIALSLVLIATLGCKKANDAAGTTAGSSGGSGGSGSATVTGSATGSATAADAAAGGGSGGSNVTGSAAPADDFDDKVDLSKQPTRAAEQQAIVDTAAAALRTLMAKAKTAKDGKELCAALKPLGKQMAGLDKLQPPAGVDAKKFADAHDAVFSQIDPGPPGYCDDAEDTSVAKLRYVVSDIRDRFVAFVTMGGS